MNAPFKTPTLGLGDVIRLPDNSRDKRRIKRKDQEGKHLCVIVAVADGQAYVAPILTDKTGTAVCPLDPRDMPNGLLNRSSYLAYDLTASRSLEVLQKEVERDQPKTSTCPPATWQRIQKGLRAPTTTLPSNVRRELGLVAPARRVLRDLTQVADPSGSARLRP